MRNMGLRYIRFRAMHEVMRKTGLLKSKFPINPPLQNYIQLEQWKKSSGNFFFSKKSSLQFATSPSIQLKEWFENFKEGKLVFFSSTQYDLGKDYNWITNPDTNFQYDINKHWTEIADYSKEAGDIKYLWEKSRFSFLYDIIRYDYHFDKDCGEFVFSEIISWINANPINCGPNYRCSQEISLRVLNWTFALHYYRESEFLTESIFRKIQFAIYWQINHVYRNINFSRIAVRNNHAITETLTLYLAGLLYPQFPDAGKWKAKGKAWFEEEIAYQVYEDGTFLQFSMNYHRVVIQLLTWAIVLAEKNNESFSPTVYERAKKSLNFLRTCMVDENGWLPNYGANDGALFFKLNSGEFRDFRPQLNALASALKIDLLFPEKSEDIHWYGMKNIGEKEWQPAQGIHQFNRGGYYIIREENTLTLIRCGNHKDRPSQADNLHLDIWYNGENILSDAGSYKYNTDERTLKYFMGTSSHNTVMLDDNDQMKKGARFIWYNWTQRVNALLKEEADTFNFFGTISAFEHIANGILHTREIIKTKGKLHWIIRDTIINKPRSVSMKQLWHLPMQHSAVSWKSISNNKEQITPLKEKGLISELYGKKETCEMIIFQSHDDTIVTEFEIEN